ncbi:hypothetical protein SNE40_013986 [Patella caerulea]|uniref:Fibrinogen C-terminal domain-containing protein n=2 Tax=Patella caerulea TaxID=87958 RepID=A0AAN8PPU8_PATCE
MANMSVMTLLTVFVVSTLASPLLFNHLDKHQYTDCQKINDAGYKKTGQYLLWYPKGNDTNLHPFTVECQMKGNAAYTVIQRRMYGNENFYRTFIDYVNGFGHPQGDYWAGLNLIYHLTSTGNNVLTVQMQDWSGNSKNARYSYFRLIDNVHFVLNIGGFYSTDVADDLSFDNGYAFATYDKPDVSHCASNQKGGWWYNYCTYALPNGVYYPGGPYTPSSGFYDGIYWKDWLGYGYSLKFISLTLSNQ